MSSVVKSTLAPATTEEPKPLPPLEPWPDFGPLPEPNRDIWRDGDYGEFDVDFGDPYPDEPEEEAASRGGWDDEFRFPSHPPKRDDDAGRLCSGRGKGLSIIILRKEVVDEIGPDGLDAVREQTSQTAESLAITECWFKADKLCQQTDKTYATTHCTAPCAPATVYEPKGGNAAELAEEIVEAINTMLVRYNSGDKELKAFMRWLIQTQPGKFFDIPSTHTRRSEAYIRYGSWLYGSFVEAMDAAAEFHSMTPQEREEAWVYIVEAYVASSGHCEPGERERKK